MATCKGCGAEINWIKTDAGRMMPINKAPTPYWENPYGRGKVILLSGKVIACDLSGPREDVTGFGYTSHFSTCPSARQLRRK